jgi:hypothetical protein
MLRKSVGENTSIAPEHRFIMRYFFVSTVETAAAHFAYQATSAISRSSMATPAESKAG